MIAKKVSFVRDNSVGLEPFKEIRRFRAGEFGVGYDMDDWETWSEPSPASAIWQSPMLVIKLPVKSEQLISKVRGYEEHSPQASGNDERGKQIKKSFPSPDGNGSEKATLLPGSIFTIRDLVKGLSLGDFEPLDAGSTELTLTFAGDVRAREPLRVDFDEVFVESFFRREFKDSP